LIIDFDLVRLSMISLFGPRSAKENPGKYRSCRCLKVGSGTTPGK
jgi:hypothetical protein